MFPGLNPRKMQQMMRQMGIQQVDIPATKVIIKSEEKDIIIINPSVQKVNMMGQETFQISGEVHEETPREALPASESAPEISEEDVKTVMAQAGASEKKARKALEEAQGDLAKAIIDLTNSS